MIPPQEMNAIASEKKAQIDRAEALRRKAERLKLEQESSALLEKCITQIKDAANAGRFSVEVDVPTNSKIIGYIFDKLRAFNPVSLSDGYTRDFVVFKW